MSEQRAVPHSSFNDYDRGVNITDGVITPLGATGAVSEPTVPVPVSLIEHLKAAHEALSNADQETWVRELQMTVHNLSRAKVFAAQRELSAAVALLSQPTPTAEPCPECLYVEGHRDDCGRMDDYIVQRDASEPLRIEDMAPGATPVVCICGSTRFRDDMADANRRLTLDGSIVVAPGVFGHSGDAMTDEQKIALDALHFRKIDLAESIYVVNPGGYIGESTAREIAYAERTGKPVAYLVDLSTIRNVTPPA